MALAGGWFGRRWDDRGGLGDWTPNPQRLPNGVAGIAEKITALGMSFGLWFEPEAVSRDSALYEEHPDWLIATPGRNMSHGRNEYLLDFSRPEVVDNIYRQMAAVLGSAKVSYVKWDMNRSISECYSSALPPERQGEVFHRYILGVYELYERLSAEFPHILFESCSSGGGRFDPGMLYYAPQAWARTTPTPWSAFISSTALPSAIPSAASVPTSPPCQTTRCSAPRPRPSACEFFPGQAGTQCGQEFQERQNFSVQAGTPFSFWPGCASSSCPTDHKRGCPDFPGLSARSRQGGAESKYKKDVSLYYL